MKLRKMWLNINGVDRMFACDPENDSLADVLRRMGCTSVKVGCGTGVCGSCTVILDGELIRSCTRKITKVKEYSKVITVEGIGTPTHLHPIQYAFMQCGAVQCGFCIPGFIVSTYALLQKNPNPTRSDVRQWFYKTRNICRCTGYKQIVDAVMEAAKVMRGEKTIEEITYKSEGEDVYGSSMPRPTAAAKACGLFDYGDDIIKQMPKSTVQLAIVQSEVAHANIISIDTSEAEKMPGVIKVLTAKDVKGTNIMPNVIFNPRAKGNGNDMPIINGKKIYRRGDVVAVVCAETREEARAAAKKVKQNLEILPAYMTAVESLAPGAMQIFEGTPNQMMVNPMLHGDQDASEVIDDAYCSVEGSFHTQHEPHMPIEPDTVQAYWDSEGNLCIQCKAQATYQVRSYIAGGIGLDQEKIRVITNPVGGSFGSSVYAGSYAIVATAVQNLDRPCALTMSYEEFMHFSGKRTASYHNARLACDENGKLVAAEWDSVMDTGPYVNQTDLELPAMLRLPYHGYSLPNAKGLGRMVLTNHSHGVAYRGFGSPEAYAQSEALMDMLARKMGMDPFEFRYNNLVQPGEKAIYGELYKEYPMKEMFDKARPVYEQYKAEAAAKKAEGKLAGVGVSFGGFQCTLGGIDSADMYVELNPDNTVTVYNTWEDMGQGGDIGTVTLTAKALEPLGIKPEQIRFVMCDTKLCPDSGVAAGSRSHIMYGLACINGCNKLLDAMRKPDGSFRTYDEMKAEGIEVKYTGHADYFNTGMHEPDVNRGQGEARGAYMYGLNICEVEVDPETGKATVVRYTVVADVGKIGNKLAVDGQAFGGTSHSIGIALTEDYFDVQKDKNILVCGVPTILDVPDDFNAIYVETPRDPALTPFGSSGCSETFQSSGHVSVINAIEDAAGVRIYEEPARPEKIKAALEAKARGEDLKPEPYFFGSDFEDELQEIINNPM
jgi:aldehyde oxidoreductase